MVINYVEKMDGTLQYFDKLKIQSALLKAGMGERDVLDITNKIVSQIDAICYDRDVQTLQIQKIHDIVEYVLKDQKYDSVYNEYSSYRHERDRVRQSKSELMKVIGQLGVETDRDNGNVGNNFSSKLLRIASEANKISNLSKMPKSMAKNHENGYLHYHDLDSLNLTPNCLHNDTLSILKNGFNTGYGYIRSPKRIDSAANLVCIILQSCQN